MEHNKHSVSESTMELIAHLYSFMDEADKNTWCMEEAVKMVNDQYLYEIAEGFTPPYYSAQDFFEIISDLIALERLEEEESSGD